MNDSPNKRPVLPHEIDDLTWYIFHNYRALMTPAEAAAYKMLILGAKAEGYSAGMKERLGRVIEAAAEYAEGLLDRGSREFLVATRDRILRDHAREVVLNRCSKCGSLARTPLACLCPACGHTWYESRGV